MLGNLQALDPRKERLSPLDAAFLYLEQQRQPMHVGCLAVLDGCVPFESFRETQGQRLGRLRRYRQRPIRPPFDLILPIWEADPAFDPSYHIRHVRLPTPGGETELHRVVDELFAAPFDARRPLWEIYLIDGYEGGRSAMLMKVHHCMIDGVSGAQVLEVMTDATPDASTAPSPVRGNGRGHSSGLVSSSVSTLSRWQSAAAAAPADVLHFARSALGAVGVVGEFARQPISRLPINGPLSHGRRVVWATFPLDDFLAMRGAATCKVNDIVLTVIAGALRSYLGRHGATIDERGVRALVPVSVRSAGEHLTLGNRVSAMITTLPLDIADPLERLQAIARETRALKDRGQREAFDFLLAAAGVFPAPVGASLARLAESWPVVHTVCTNVPGSPHVRYVLGCPVREMHPIVPLGVGVGLGFAILSYGGTLSICATADAGLVPDADAIADALAYSAAELRARLDVEPANAPAPTLADLTPTIAALMTRDTVTLEPEDPVSWAWETMNRHRIRHLPVIDHTRRLVGVVTHRDLLAAADSTLSSPEGSARPRLRPWVRVEDVMEAHVSTVTADDSAAEAGRRMVRHKIGCLPVVGAGGELKGIITEEDFMRWATEHMGGPLPAANARNAHGEGVSTCRSKPT